MKSIILSLSTASVLLATQIAKAENDPCVTQIKNEALTRYQEDGFQLNDPPYTVDVHKTQEHEYSAAISSKNSAGVIVDYLVGAIEQGGQCAIENWAIISSNAGL